MRCGPRRCPCTRPRLGAEAGRQAQGRIAVLPIVAIVGRPNVGKSTLFNSLTRTRDAIVADVPGVTRDRQYGYARGALRPCVLIDTGGLLEQAQGLEGQIRR